MSETIVQIVGINGPADHNIHATVGYWDMSLQVVQTDMTFQEVSNALHDGRQYKLVEVFDKEAL